MAFLILFSVFWAQISLALSLRIFVMIESENINENRAYSRNYDWII